MSRPLALLVASSLLIGCHGRYKRNADALGKVRLEVRAPAGPQVSVDTAPLPTSGEAPATEVIEAGVGVATVLLGHKVEKKLRRSISSDEAEAALTAAFLGDVAGEPLPYTVGTKGRAKLTIEIVDFGLDASGGTPAAYVMTRTTIHDKTGKKVYKATEMCSRTIGPGMDVPLTTVDDLVAMKQLSELSPKRMNTVVTAVVEQCGEEITQELLTPLD